MCREGIGKVELDGCHRMHSQSLRCPPLVRERDSSSNGKSWLGALVEEQPAMATKGLESGPTPNTGGVATSQSRQTGEGQGVACCCSETMQRLLCPSEGGGGDNRQGGTMRVEPEKTHRRFINIYLYALSCTAACVRFCIRGPGFCEC